MAEFKDAIRVVLKHEGGYSNDPADAGGETNFGISKRAHPDVDVKNLTRGEAEKIYKRHYWDTHSQLARLSDQRVATKTFDLLVNMRADRAIKILQHALNQLTDAKSAIPTDGKLGPRTVARANDL